MEKVVKCLNLLTRYAFSISALLARMLALSLLILAAPPWSLSFAIAIVSFARLICGVEEGSSDF